VLNVTGVLALSQTHRHNAHRTAETVVEVIFSQVILLFVTMSAETGYMLSILKN